jgi:hypothetical protein
MNSRFSLPVLFFVFLPALVVAGCGSPSGGVGGGGTGGPGGGDDPPAFVAVTNITGVPAEATVDDFFTLTGTVIPSNATNKTIIWSVANAGSTGANIMWDDTLYATAMGTAIITATITNGQTASSDYTKNFMITVEGIGAASINITPAALEDESFTFPTHTVYKTSYDGITTFQTRTLTIIPPGGTSYTGIKWFIGTEHKEDADDSLTFTLDAADYLVGQYYVGVEVWKGAIPYSKTITFNVAD